MLYIFHPICERSDTTEKQNTVLIRRTIKEFNWERALSNTKVNEKVDAFNRTIPNTLSNFIPDEVTVCDDKVPPWFNNRIKTLIQEKKWYI